MQPSTPRLRWSLDGDSSGARLEGEIDEFADMNGLAAALSGPHLTLDLGGVRRINSLGVRAWMQFLQKIGGKLSELRRCPPAFVEQLNCIRGFSGGAKVATVLLPYTCDSCGRLNLIEMQMGTYKPGAPLPTDPPCEKCGKPCVFDDIPDRYLGFTRHGVR